MKKIFLIIVTVTICHYSFGQIEMSSNGNVGIGGAPSIYSKCKLRVYKDGHEIQLNPNNPTPEIGVSCAHINFWHSTYGWHELGAKTFTKISDSTLKEDIRPLKNATTILKQLKTYSYYFKADSIRTRQRDYGILAQEVESVLPELVHTSSKGDKLVDYDGFIPFLIEGFKEQQVLIEKQQKAIEELQRKIESLENCCNTKNQKSFQEFELTNPINMNNEGMKIYQNAPNPFNESTTIQCYIPQTIRKAELCVYNMQGVQLKCVTVSERGTVDVQIQAGQLAAGVYTYLLIGDGETSDAKQMILTK